MAEENIRFILAELLPAKMESCSRSAKTIEYTVGAPGGAAVCLDKMNVFYIGVDNPITIGSSSTGWDKTSVSMTGGTITGSDSNRTVKVAAVLESVQYTVSADRKVKSNLISVLNEFLIQLLKLDQREGKNAVS